MTQIPSTARSRFSGGTIADPLIIATPTQHNSFLDPALLVTYAPWGVNSGAQVQCAATGRATFLLKGYGTADGHLVVTDGDSDGTAQLNSSVNPCLYLQPRSTNAATALTVEIADTGGLDKVQVYAEGTLVLLKAAAPADALFASSSFALWLDATPGATKLMVKAKDSNGAVRTGSLALA